MKTGIAGTFDLISRRSREKQIGSVWRWTSALRLRAFPRGHFSDVFVPAPGEMLSGPCVSRGEMQAG